VELHSLSLHGVILKWSTGQLQIYVYTLPAVTTNSTIFWDTMPGSLVEDSDVSEEFTTSICRVEKKTKQGNGEN
jgi:hypothetical protein